MKTNLRIALIAAGVAVGSTLLTLGAVSLTSRAGATRDGLSWSSADVVSGMPAGKWVAASVNPAMETDFTVAAENAVNGVVSIKSYVDRQRYSQAEAYDPFYEFFFGGRPRRQQQEEQSEPKLQQSGLGSGVIISPDGYIATNNHVIDGADRLEVTLNDNRTYEAVVLGSDPVTDLALIKIEAQDLPVIPIGDSEKLKVGQWVLAVGNPFGFTSTVTAGIVSAKARSISAVTHSRQMGIESFIQTDAAVNPGNSGGALVNLDGELVGINTAIYSQTGNYAGYSFAIPTSIMAKVVSDIREYGTVQRAVLGIEYRELTPELAKENDIKAVKEGLYVGRVVDLSAASKAGIEKGDVITGVNGVPVVNGAQLTEQLSKYSPGHTVKIDFVRDNKARSVEVTLLNNQGSTGITQAAKMSDLGCEFKELTRDEAREMGLNGGGVKVAEVHNGKMSRAGIKAGFVMLYINKTRVTSPEDVDKLYTAIMKSTDADKVMFITGVYPDGRRAHYAVDLAD